MVEQGTHKPLVVGSNPSLATEKRASPRIACQHAHGFLPWAFMCKKGGLFGGLPSLVVAALL